MQIVILAGGLATRMRPITDDLPKAMIPVAGRPFLEWQIELFRSQGIRDIVLCVSHLADKISACFGDGTGLGVTIEYSEDGDRLLGTAGAVKKAEPFLQDKFFLTYGDSYLRLDYQAVMERFREREELGLMVVYRNRDRLERSNVVVDGDFVTVYDKEAHSPGMEYINHGLAVLRKEALDLVPARVPYSQEEWFGQLIEKRELLAYEVQERFYEIGSPRGLREFELMAARSGTA